LHRVLLPTKRKAHNRTLLFSITLLKHGQHFDYWNQTMNMHMSTFYIDCHEAQLCCYIVIYTENLLHPLQLFYFHLWPIYWFFLIKCQEYSCVMCNYTKTQHDMHSPEKHKGNGEKRSFVTSWHVSMVT
jgi:hypothetical protein